MTPAADWVSTRSPAPQLVARWSPRLVDTLVLLAITGVVEADRPVADRRAASAEIRAILPDGLSTTHRLMILQRAAGRLHVWGERFDPRPGWTPVGADLAAEVLTAAVLWTRMGRVRADLLESGPLSRGSRRRARRVAETCAAQFGGAFAGVRLISLAPAAPGWEDIQASELLR